MNSKYRSQLHRVVWVIALLPCVAASLGFAAQNPQRSPCTTSEHRQFDFWAGDWDAFDVDNPAEKVARVHVDLILDGCVLRESYEGADGHQGQSFSMYDSSRNIWHQSWVTNRGELLIVEGHGRAGEMVLSGTEQTTNGPKMVRGTWKEVNEGVRETAVTSVDGGKSWKPWFDLLFRRHKP